MRVQRLSERFEYELGAHGSSVTVMNDNWVQMTPTEVNTKLLDPKFREMLVSQKSEIHIKNYSQFCSNLFPDQKNKCHRWKGPQNCVEEHF